MAGYRRGAFILSLSRLALLIFIPMDVIKGAGDFSHFFHLAEIPGLPYLNFWVEFPPVFPFLSKLLFSLSGGNELTYDVMLFFLLLFADLGSLWFFYQISTQIWPGQIIKWKVLSFGLVLAVLPYYWWYFDPICVFFVLWGLFLIVTEDLPLKLGLVIGFGVLIKLFPLLLLAPTWGKYQIKRFFLICTLALFVSVGIYAIFYWSSPEFTKASLVSQSSKGSWESVWALIDGNYRTGLFGPLWERLDPALASLSRGNQAVIPTWLTFMVFAGLGGWVILGNKSKSAIKAVAALLFSFCLLFIWSPGYSPQWVIYLIPLIILVFPTRISFLSILMLLFVHLVEWPWLLSSGLFWGLNITIPLRTGIYLIIAYLSFRELRAGSSPPISISQVSGL